jgi:hypothetical protein
LTAVPEAAVLVVRGDALDPAVLRADALRFVRRYPGWGRYGVSAFLASDAAEVDVLCETRLERFAPWWCSVATTSSPRASKSSRPSACD